VPFLNHISLFCFYGWFFSSLSAPEQFDSEAALQRAIEHAARVACGGTMLSVETQPVGERGACWCCRRGRCCCCESVQLGLSQAPAWTVS
jgi:hypothetical protein